MAGFLVPYVFVFHNELLLIGSTPNIIFYIFTAILGITCLSAAIIGSPFVKTTWIERILLGLVSIGLINASGIYVTIGSIVVLVLIGIYQKYMMNK